MTWETRIALGGNVKKFQEELDELCAEGWEPLSIAIDRASTMHVLLRRPVSAG